MTSWSVVNLEATTARYGSLLHTRSVRAALNTPADFEDLRDPGGIECMPLSLFLGRKSSRPLASAWSYYRLAMAMVWTLQQSFTKYASKEIILLHSDAACPPRPNMRLIPVYVISKQQWGCSSLSQSPASIRGHCTICGNRLCRPDVLP